jgi:DNA adenine methylase
MSGRRYAYDLNEYLIELYKAVQNGYELPNSINEEQYNYIKSHKDEDKALTGFVGFGCSFAGKWFGGYARDHNGRNYCKNAYNSIIKQSTAIKDVVFDCKDYKTLNPYDCLIYCDPPYKGTTKYTGVPDFDTNEFWEIMRQWSKNNNVYISEYSAPDDFHCVLEIPTKTDIRNSKNQNIKRIEKLFTYDTTKH